MQDLFRSIVCVVTLGSLIACSQKKNDQANQAAAGAGKSAPPLAVEAMILHPQPLSSTIEVPGSLLAYEETEIRAEISGRVVKINFKEGSTVKQGDLLVKLFDEDLQAQLKKLQVQLQIAKKTAERQKELVKINGISQQEYDLSALQVSNLEADIELIRVSINKTIIKAPYSGRLGLKDISVGAYISPSNIITTISQVDKLKLQFTVPEKYGSQVKNDQELTFQLDGSNDQIPAHVMAKEASIEENTRSLVVRAVVKSNNPLLVPGAFAKVKMVLGKQNDALMVPTECIVPQGRKKQVILCKGSKAQFVEVTTGVRDSARIQVVTGLFPGDTVVTTGLLFLRPGADIKISTLK